MKATITIEDLNAAKAMSWDTKTCIISQFAKRVLKEEILGSSGCSVITRKHIHVIHPSPYDIAFAFDDAHGTHGTRDYSLVESMLPYEVDIEKRKPPTPPTPQATHATDNLQESIDEASKLANEVLIDLSFACGHNTVKADTIKQTNKAILALCGALQIVKNEFQYYQKK